ncbi:diguanylate cyclase [Acrocarpospora pleiomorpha]|uniref:Putative 4-hydroxy-4-methyl-2-oxoglutarate aldolase n=1 Tax=Acrocarpospora pleiomorpha TaxID=90975 RepID=A0A5M3XG41_9ACTN|nr:RraA family protein [Acrocarpospora pleiomorpha]GES19099.1 diguanylate cyclase [Acrocarpospora pleiomorpha]
MTQAAALLALGTGTVSDALDRLGIPGQCAGLAGLVPGGTVAGPAFTVRYGPNGLSGGTVGDYIDDVPPGHVVVLDNRGRTDATVWGDILTTVASGRGVGGTVIDGVCRDLDRSLETGYPIFARGNWMRTGKDRVRAEEIGGPVGIGGVRVHPGDILIGDRDGVLALPADRLDQIHEVAAAIAAAENEIRAHVATGLTLREARARTGYHHLQAQERES